MATVIPFVFAPDDEKQFLSFLATYGLTAYPERVPPGYAPIPVNGESQARLTEDAYYLAAEQLAPVLLHTLKRGQDRGLLEIDEIQSPVMYMLRSVVDEAGQLRSGKLWTEFTATGDAVRNPAFPEAFRRMWLDINEHFKTRYHRSRPSGFFVGMHAARLHKSGTVIREEGRKGGLLAPYR